MLRPALLGLAIVAASVACGVALAADSRPKAPPIAGPTVTGGTASLAALRGRPVIVNVWSSW